MKNITVYFLSAIAYAGQSMCASASAWSRILNTKTPEGKIVLNTVFDNVSSLSSTDCLEKDTTKASMVAMLICAGARVDIKDNTGKTSMDYASQWKEALPKVHQTMRYGLLKQNFEAKMAVQIETPWFVIHDQNEKKLTEVERRAHQEVCGRLQDLARLSPDSTQQNRATTAKSKFTHTDEVD